MCSNLFYIDIYMECMMWKLIVTEKKTLTKLMMSVELGN